MQSSTVRLTVRLFVLSLFMLNGWSASGQTMSTHCPESEARQFDFWIGEWDVVNKQPTSERQWVERGIAVDHVHPVLDGCAIVEHWSGNLGANQIRGFSIRTWDPSRQQWVLLLSWPGPERPSFSFLEGDFSHGRGEFFRRTVNAAGDSVTSRFTFSDVSPAALRWDAAISTDERATWSTNWIMEFSRRDERRSDPVMTAPSYSLHRCTSPAARSLDPLFGIWESTGLPPTAPGSVRLETMPILDGCAAIQRLSVHAENRTFKAFLFLSPDLEAENWTAFLLSVDDRSFVELQGARDGDSSVLDAQSAHRLEFRDEGPGRVVVSASLPGLPELTAENRSLSKR